MRINPCNLEVYFIRKESEMLQVTHTWREKKDKKIILDNDNQCLGIYVHLLLFWLQIQRIWKKFDFFQFLI